MSLNCRSPADWPVSCARSQSSQRRRLWADILQGNELSHPFIICIFGNFSDQTPEAFLEVLTVGRLQFFSLQAIVMASEETSRYLRLLKESKATGISCYVCLQMAQKKTTLEAGRIDATLSPVQQ